MSPGFMRSTVFRRPSAKPLTVPPWRRNSSHVSKVKRSSQYVGAISVHRARQGGYGLAADRRLAYVRGAVELAGHHLAVELPRRWAQVQAVAARASGVLDASLDEAELPADSSAEVSRVKA